VEPRVEIVTEGDDCVVLVSGELDMACADKFRELLSGLHGSVIVDLEEVTFMDSSAIGVLVVTHKHLEADGGTLRIRNPHDVPREVLVITGLGGWIVD
jgi:anti-sigma B factor antagonist